MKFSLVAVSDHHVDFAADGSGLFAAGIN